MTKCKKPTPYDPKLIAAQCNPVTLRLGCAAGCWKGEDFDMCGKPPVAIRRWTRDDGYDDCELLPEEGVYGPACKLHANHDVVPLSEVLKAVADAGCWKRDPSLIPPLPGILPYDPMRIFALCDPTLLRLGCTTGVSRDGGLRILRQTRGRDPPLDALGRPRLRGHAFARLVRARMQDARQP